MDKLAKADMRIKMLLNNENILATGKDLDGNSPFEMIEGTVTFSVPFLCFISMSHMLWVINCD